MNKQHDIGIVLVTYDMDRTEGGLWVPGKYSHSRIDATAIEYRRILTEGRSPYLLLTGGRLAFYSPVLADIVGTTLVEKLGVPYKIVVEENFGSERRALNTAENVLYPLEDLTKRGIYHIIFISNEFQVRRIQACCRIYGKSYNTLEVLVAEDIIKRNDHSREQEMEHLQQQARDEGLYAHHNGWRKELLDTRIGATALRVGAHVRKALSLLRKTPWEIDDASKK